MDATRFDTIARFFADRRLSRRRMVAKGGTGLAAGALAATGLSSAHAQEATPAAAGEKVEFLFVQSFQSGTVAPKAGEEGTYTLTLAQGLGQTIFFSDRPQRIVGAAPTADFLAGLGFPPDNPPNAALVLAANPGDEGIAVLEVANPIYDEATHTATYDVTVLAEWERTLELGFNEVPTDLAQLAPSFGAAHLFIDDCPDITTCYTFGLYPAGPVPGGPIGLCWNTWLALCLPCSGQSIDEIQQSCNRKYPDTCGGSCIVYAP
jgi:hypothetical protein